MSAADVCGAVLGAWKFAVVFPVKTNTGRSDHMWYTNWVEMLYLSVSLLFQLTIDCTRRFGGSTWRLEICSCVCCGYASRRKMIKCGIRTWLKWYIRCNSFIFTYQCLRLKSLGQYLWLDVRGGSDPNVVLHTNWGELVIPWWGCSSSYSLLWLKFMGHYWMTGGFQLCFL